MSALMNEQDQVALLKDYWNRYGNFLLTAILVVAVGMVGWRYWQTQQTDKKNDASFRYQSLLLSASKKDTTNINAKAMGLINTYPNTIYANLAALMLASQDVQAQKYNAATTQLNWVMAHSVDASIKTLAQLNLARLLLAEKKYTAALNTLHDTPPAFAGIADMIKGDIYAAMKQTTKASEAYIAALKTLHKDSPLRQTITMKRYNLPQLTTKTKTNT